LCLRWRGALAFYVYIMASERNGTLYIGHTDSVIRRAWEHREGIVPGFTSKYGVKTLVYYEAFDRRDEAFARERAMKKWNRAWKLELIERFNPGWRDLAKDLGPLGPLT
jgi:putative endonuclease